MIFSSYRKGATFAADLVNTVGSISLHDHVPDRASLRRFLDHYQIAPRRAVTQRDLREIHALRDRLRSLFEAAPSKRVRLLNQLLKELPAIPQLDAGESAHVLTLVPATSAVADHVAVAAIAGVASMLAELGPERLGTCEADDCEDAYADVSKNGSRRFCSDSCGSRTHVAAYRARRTSENR